MITPLRSDVLVKEIGELKESFLHIPGTALRDNHLIVEVINMGSSCRKFPIKIGDKLLIDRYTGADVEDIDGLSYKLLRADQDVIGIIR
jgi:co-chaperonin GroES (HSP10)